MALINPCTTTINDLLCSSRAAVPLKNYFEPEISVWFHFSDISLLN
jgi:hypothetical protein